MDIKSIIRQLFDRVLNEGDLDFLDQIISDDYVDHNPLPGVPPGREGVRIKIKALRRAFPDIQFILEDVISDGAIAAARYRWQGTQKEEFAGIAPTRKTVEVGGMDFYRVEKEKISEHWHTIDELGLLRQLGAITIK